MDGKSVCITGAGGFIGRQICRRLIREGARLKVFLRYTSRPAHENFPEIRDASVETFRGDICDKDAMRRAMDGADIVLHLAALVGIPYSYECPAEVLRVNAQGTANVLDRARELETPRIVTTSTSEVYGSARFIPMPLDHPLQAQSPYAASKIAADQLALSYARSFNLPVAVLRPFNTYGPGQSARAVIPTILSQALHGKSLTLGNLESSRDFTFVDDTVSAFLAAGTEEKALGRVTTCGTGQETSIAELVRLASELTGRELKVKSDPDRIRPQASEVDRLCCDPEPAREILGWTPKVDIKEGLSRTLDWMRDHLDEMGQGYER